MATKKVHHKSSARHHTYHPSRPARIREILITLVFGSLVLIFITLTMINVTSGY